MSAPKCGPDQQFQSRHPWCKMLVTDLVTEILLEKKCVDDNFWIFNIDSGVGGEVISNVNLDQNSSPTSM